MSVAQACSESKQRIVLQLMENTGRHMLDSGDYYGRNWQRNQALAKVLLEKEELDLQMGSEDLQKLVEHYDETDRSSVEWDWLSPTINVYHWMASRLDFDDNKQGWFDAFVEWWDESNDEMAWLGYAEEFPGWLADQWITDEGQMLFVDIEDPEPCYESDEFDWVDLATMRERWKTGSLMDEDNYYLEKCGGRHPSVEGFLGEGRPDMVNTYNGECWLSETLQWVSLQIDGVGFVLLQVHGGCDVRGGYTKPIVYQVNGESEYALYDVCDGDLSCESGETEKHVCNGQVYEEHHYWNSDGGSGWLFQGGSGVPNDCDIANIEAVDLDAIDDLDEFWESVIGPSMKRKHPKFDPYALWQWVKDYELPNLNHSADDVEEHLENIQVPDDDPQANSLTAIFRRVLKSVYETGRLGVRFYSKEQGYCPICGGHLNFYPRGVD